MSQETPKLVDSCPSKRKTEMGLFDFTIENSTLPSRPWKYGQDYWSSFELYPEWKGSTYYAFRGIAHHDRDYWTATPVVVKTFQNKHARTNDWALYCQTAEVTRKLASGYNKYLNTIGCRFLVDFVKPTEVVMENVSDVMPVLQYIMRFRKRFSTNEVVVMEDLLEGDFTTFVTDKGEAINNGTGILDAFAHYTYHNTDGQTLVCGLQGVEEEEGDGGKHVFKLTNSVVHSVNGQFGRKDRGEIGIDQFFANHVCIKGLCEGFRKPDMHTFVEPSAPLYSGFTEPKALEASCSIPPVHSQPHSDIHGPPSYSTRDPNMPPPYHS